MVQYLGMEWVEKDIILYYSPDVGGGWNVEWNEKHEPPKSSYHYATHLERQEMQNKRGRLSIDIVATEVG